MYFQYIIEIIYFSVDHDRIFYRCLIFWGKSCQKQRRLHQKTLTLGDNIPDPRFSPQQTLKEGTRIYTDFTTLVVDARLLGAFRVCLVCTSETTRVSCPLLFYCCILPVPSMANSFSCPWTRGDWKQPSDVPGRALKI